jgi:hypothetical protein
MDIPLGLPPQEVAVIAVALASGGSDGILIWINDTRWQKRKRLAALTRGRLVPWPTRTHIAGDCHDP